MLKIYTNPLVEKILKAVITLEASKVTLLYKCLRKDETSGASS